MIAAIHMLSLAMGSIFGGWRAAGTAEIAELDDDLPCPWCMAPTSESDPACPSCGRTFGVSGASASVASG